MKIQVTSNSDKVKELVQRLRTRKAEQQTELLAQKDLFFAAR